MCPNCQSTLWTNAFHAKTFNEAGYNDNTEKENDEEDNFPKTDMHPLISSVLSISI